MNLSEKVKLVLKGLSFIKDYFLDRNISVIRNSE